MKLLVFLQLVLIADSCLEFWTKWEGYPCLTGKDLDGEIRCYKTKKLSFAKIIDNYAVITCNNEAIYPQLLRCLDVKYAQFLFISDCRINGLDIGQFAMDSNITNIYFNFSKEEESFGSLLVRNAPWLESIFLIGSRTSSGLLNVTFDHLSSLTVLQIENHDFITFLPRPFGHLTHLSDLIVKKGTLQILPPEVFYGLDSMKILDLSYNRIEEISPLVFSNLSKLERLDLSGNQISSLSTDLFSDLINLETLKLKYNKLTALPENLFGSCPKLAYLSIGDNTITELPGGFLRGLKDFKSFSAINCRISYLDEDLFSDATNLSGVYLTKNKISYLPKNLFKNNKKLVSFYIGVNEMMYLPSSIFDGLSLLKNLQLSLNQLKTIPERLFQHLSSLQMLDLSFNQLKYLPEEIFVSLINLETLSLYFNNFIRLPIRYPFGTSKHLSKVNVSHNGLKYWPNINWANHNFSSVDLSKNRFEYVTLPAFTRNNVSVSLSKNHIKTIYLDRHIYGNSSPVYNLAGNEIICDCRLQTFLHYLKFNPSATDRKNLNCYRQENTKLLDIWPIYSVCPVKENCPASCQCFRDEEQVIINCSGECTIPFPEVLSNYTRIVTTSRNSLSKVGEKKRKNVTQLDSSNNYIVEDRIFPLNLHFLSLDEDRLSTLSSSIRDQMYRSDNYTIFFSENNWSCGDCHPVLRNWLIWNEKKIIDYATSCHNGLNILIYTRTGDSLVVSASFAGWKIALICIFVMFLMVLLIVGYYHYRECFQTENFI